MSSIQKPRSPQSRKTQPTNTSKSSYENWVKTHVPEPLRFLLIIIGDLGGDRFKDYIRNHPRQAGCFSLTIIIPLFAFGALLGALLGNIRFPIFASSNTPTVQSTMLHTPTSTQTATATITPSVTFSATPTPTMSPTETATPTVTNTPTATIDVLETSEAYSFDVSGNNIAVAVNDVVFSPDGREILTASDDGVRLWNWDTVTKTATLNCKFSGHTKKVWAAQFSFDGKQIVTASDDNTARLLTTNCHQRFVFSYSDKLDDASFSPDGKLIVTGSEDYDAQIWNLDTRRLQKKLSGHDDAVNMTTFSENGKYIATAGDNTARIWDVPSGKQLYELNGHESEVNSVDISPDNNFIVTGSKDHTARLWDISTQKEKCHLMHPDSVTSAVFSPGGNYILTGSADKIARLWNSKTCQEIRDFEGNTDAVTTVDFSPDENWVITAGEDGSVRIWPSGIGE